MIPVKSDDWKRGNPKNDAERMTDRGKCIAAALGLRRVSGFSPPRYQLGPEFGTKTAVGVYEVVQRLAKETDMEINCF